MLSAALFSVIGFVLAALTPVELGRQASPAVFRLICESSSGDITTGTGFVISDSGLVVTNDHVILSALSVFAERDGIRVPVLGCYGSDHRRDLAILQLDLSQVPSTLVISPVRLAAESLAEPGEEVAVLGHPGGVTQANFTIGRITSIERVPHRLCFDARISQGSSGSPLFSLATGEVIGVVTSFFTGGQELNFATPVDYLHPLIGKARSGAAALRPFSVNASMSRKRSAPFRSRNLAISAAALLGFAFFVWRVATT